MFKRGCCRYKGRNKKGKPYVKKAPFAVLKKVCDRACQELREDADSLAKSDPLLWLMHGGPGVGKAEVLKLLHKFLEEVCGYQMGIEFQMAAS